MIACVQFIVNFVNKNLTYIKLYNLLRFLTILLLQSSEVTFAAKDLTAGNLLFGGNPNNAKSPKNYG